MIRYRDAFANFNPLAETLLEPLRWELGYVFQESKKILPDDFTIRDLNAGLEILEQLRHLQTIAMSDLRESHSSDELREGVFHTPPLDFFRATEHVEQPSRPDGKAYPWSAVFAVSALASISDYVMLHNKSVYYFTPTDGQITIQAMLDEQGESNSSYKQELPGEALESLGFARLFIEREQTKDKHTKRGAAVSKARLANYAPLKSAIIEHFNKLPKDLSVRKAAKLIYQGLNENLKNLFASDEPTQQIQIWLGQYKKGQLAGQEKLPPYQP